MKEFKEPLIVGVVGAGTMGQGIAQLAAQNGSSVVLYDQLESQLTKARVQLEKSLERLKEKNKISFEQRMEIGSRIAYTNVIAAFSECDLVIEAIVEEREAKMNLLKGLENVVSEKCILSSNTSSISITALGSALLHPERFCGIHFFNPAPVMPLVEIIPGLRTDPNLIEKCRLLLQRWNKNPVVAKDAPGFIVNRIARPYYGEALRIVEEGIATENQIDSVMRCAGGFKMGPFELMDLIGIDVNLMVTQTVYKDFFYDPKYKPSLLQTRMVEAGLLGRKTGVGFYSYPANITNVAVDSGLEGRIFMRIISMLVNEAVEAYRIGLASKEDIELAMQKGVGYPKGLLAWGQEIGFERISETLQDLYLQYQEERYRQSPLLKQLAKS